MLNYKFLSLISLGAHACTPRGRPKRYPDDGTPELQSSFGTQKMNRLLHCVEQTPSSNCMSLYVYGSCRAHLCFILCFCCMLLHAAACCFSAASWANLFGFPEVPKSKMAEKSKEFETVVRKHRHFVMLSHTGGASSFHPQDYVQT